VPDRPGQRLLFTAYNIAQSRIGDGYWDHLPAPPPDPRPRRRRFTRRVSVRSGRPKRARQRDLTPCHSYRIAGWRACRKACGDAVASDRWWGWRCVHHRVVRSRILVTDDPPGLQHATRDRLVGFFDRDTAGPSPREVDLAFSALVWVPLDARTTVRGRCRFRSSRICDSWSGTGAGAGPDVRPLRQPSTLPDHLPGWALRSVSSARSIAGHGLVTEWKGDGDVRVPRPH